MACSDVEIASVVGAELCGVDFHQVELCVCVCVCGGTGVPALGRVNLSTATGSGSGPTDCALGVNAVYSSVPYLHITIATAILSRCVNVTN